MITLKTATIEDTETIALLGRVTYTESHGQFIKDKSDLLNYNNKAFSISNIRKSLNDPSNHFYIIYFDALPVGYAKLILNKTHKSLDTSNACQLDKLYILDDFIPLKIGQQLLTFLEEKARELDVKQIWLATYIKNFRAIRFYKKNNYEEAGNLNFNVSGIDYPNIIFSKKI